MSPQPNAYQNALAQNVVVFNGATYRRKPRIYSTQIVRSATAGASFQGTIVLDPGLPFMLNAIKADDTADPNGAGATTGLEDWSVQVQDNESQYLWSNTAIGRIAMFGGREFGYQLPFEVLLRAQTLITITITNRAAGPTAGTASICFVGFSLLPLSSNAM
jgi:hypothetical protein